VYDTHQTVEICKLQLNNLVNNIDIKIKLKTGMKGNYESTE